MDGRSISQRLPTGTQGGKLCLSFVPGIFNARLPFHHVAAGS